MKFTGTVTLETDRLILRRLNADDACDMYENWANDEKVTRFLRWMPHKSVEESKKVLENFFICNYDDEKYLAWGIELKETHSLVGMVDMRINSDDVGEPGYAIGEKYWGKGIVTEALRRIIKHCFEDIGMYRITAVHA
ncbi:MAG: GNAT family N-acetyltransferase, partial [Clostridia bacterium]|nr:GNAT family N-acetyltransferase [Clostridia bacterium]